MEIQIDMLDVGDADAIIVQLTRSPTEQLVMLIDGGHPGDAVKCIQALQPILDKAAKKGPDLIICTHYDADHIGGLKQVAEAFKNNIGQVWLHEPHLIKDALQLAENLLNNSANGSAYHIKTYEEFVHSGQMKNISGDILESYQQMSELVKYLDSIQVKMVQPFAGQTLEGWPELKVLGPTEVFYNTCLKGINGPENLLLTESEAGRYPFKLPKLGKLFEQVMELAEDPCAVLGKVNRKVTLINQISIILQIIVEEKKYLFTGDASIESFNHVPGYPDALAKLFWLKVPHHGSENNTSPELIDIMKPVYADISGGERYLDDDVRDCMIKKNVKVRTTRDAKEDLLFPY